MKKKTFDPSVCKISFYFHNFNGLLVKSAASTLNLRSVRSNSFHEKIRDNNDDNNENKTKKTFILDSYGTKSSFNDLGRLLSKEDLKYDFKGIVSTKELNFLSPKTKKKSE